MFYLLFGISVPPSAKVPNQILSSPLDTNVSLVCLIEAYPKTINLWTRKEQVIMSGYVITERLLHLLTCFFTINARRVRSTTCRPNMTETRNRFHAHTHVLSNSKVKRCVNTVVDTKSTNGDIRTKNGRQRAN